MSKTARSRRLCAEREAIWGLVADPRQLPRWWPGVSRVEGVTGDGFTMVLSGRRGAAVRLDLRILEPLPPERISFTQQLTGTPFEGLLREWTLAVSLDADEGATIVRLHERQLLRGVSRLGLPLQRAPARRRLDLALEGLAQIFD